MRCYLVKTEGAKRYASTQADAKTKRDELVESLGVKKSQVSIEEVEIGSAKPDLLAFINELCEECDAPV